VLPLAQALSSQDVEPAVAGDGPSQDDCHARGRAGRDSLQLVRVSVGALRDVDLDVAPGEIVCISGPSGSGKTRLLRAVADLEPHGGEVRLGRTVQASVRGHEWRRRVMLVPAEVHWWAARVGEHLPQPAPHDLEALGFGKDVLEWDVGRLSSGEQQRLALLRALAREPEVVLLDEPTAHLDEATARRVERWLTDWAARRARPMLWVAHEIEQIARVARRHAEIVGARLEVRR